MELEQSDQEQVEALQKWWRENWLSLVGGLVLGLGGIIGWQYYGEAKQSDAAAASMAYEALRGELEQGSLDRAEQAVLSLAQAHQGSPYVAQAYLALAQAKAKASDWVGSEAALRAVKAQKLDDALQGLSDLRLARVLWAQGKIAEAQAQLAAPVPGFEALYAELQGDLAVSQGDTDAARAAYTLALSQDADYVNRDAIQRKLDALN